MAPVGTAARDLTRPLLATAAASETRRVMAAPARGTELSVTSAETADGGIATRVTSGGGEPATSPGGATATAGGQIAARAGGATVPAAVATVAGSTTAAGHRARMIARER
jgi:hypothetical protein